MWELLKQSKSPHIKLTLHHYVDDGKHNYVVRMHVHGNLAVDAQYKNKADAIAKFDEVKTKLPPWLTHEEMMP